MKLFKLTFLISYFSVSKNKKKALFIINIGIFLSIFAATSAMISLYVENKVSTLEFEHALYSKEKRSHERSIKEILKLSSDISNFKNIEYSQIYFTDYLKLNKFTKNALSYKDFAIPLIYYNLHDLSEVELDPNDIDYDYFTKDDGQELRALIDETNALSKTLFKKYSHLQEKITKVLYKSSYEDIKDEISDKLNIKDNEISKLNYEEAVDDFNKLSNNIDRLMDFVLHFESQIIEDYDLSIKDINKEIIDLSKIEKNLILFAFILQLIVFIIIQFFEISSVNLQIKGNIKKIKILKRK